MNNKSNTKKEYNIPIISFHGDKIANINLENTAFRLTSNQIKVSKKSKYDKEYKGFQNQTKKKFREDKNSKINSHLIFRAQQQEREAEQQAMLQVPQNQRQLAQIANLQAQVNQRSGRDLHIARLRANFRSIVQTGVFRRPVEYIGKIITGETGTKEMFVNRNQTFVDK